MADAVGIHAHPTKKLGRRPAGRREALDISSFLRVQALPDHPLVDPVPGLTYPMDHNDVAGDCVVAGLDHALQTIYALLGVPRANWTDGELLAFYQTQNPGFRTFADGGGASDGGMEIQTFLSYLQTHAGVISGFAKIDPTDAELLRAAAWVGLAVVTGEDLRAAQQKQTTWDYVKGSPDWGGHCTCTVAYQPGQTDCVTWGEVVPMTDAFVTKQVDEAWFILTPAHIQNSYFRDNFDLPGFAKAVAEITNGKIIIPVVPVNPPPPPPPLPDVLADYPFGAMDAWAAKPRSTKLAPPAAQQYLNWKHAHSL